MNLNPAGSEFEMNFFKLYIGDYQRDTSHLSIAEHGVYLLMLQMYYATEKPLPKGAVLNRMLRAQTKAERDAVSAVVQQFWTETEDGLINERADVEITKMNSQAETNARIAREREDRRKAAREQNEQSTNRATNDQPNQTPDTRHQTKPKTSLSVPTAPPDLAIGLQPVASIHSLEVPDRLACPVEDIVGLYHELMPNNPRCKVLNAARRKAITARWREASKLQAFPFSGGYASRDEAMGKWREFFAICAESLFLTGRTRPVAGSPPFLADVDFLFSPSGFAKTLENKYHREIA